MSSEKQSKILAFIGEGQKTKKEISDHFSSWYYTNAPHYIGEILTRMIKNESIKRVSRGTYAASKPKGPEPDKNQLNLFE